MNDQVRAVKDNYILICHRALETGASSSDLKTFSRALAELKVSDNFIEDVNNLALKTLGEKAYKSLNNEIFFSCLYSALLDIPKRTVEKVQRVFKQLSEPELIEVNGSQIEAIFEKNFNADEKKVDSKISMPKVPFDPTSFFLYEDEYEDFLQNSQLIQSQIHSNANDNNNNSLTNRSAVSANLSAVTLNKQKKTKTQPVMPELDKLDPIDHNIIAYYLEKIRAILSYKKELESSFIQAILAGKHLSLGDFSISITRFLNNTSKIKKKYHTQLTNYCREIYKKAYSKLNENRLYFEKKLNENIDKLSSQPAKMPLLSQEIMQELDSKLGIKA